MRRRMSLAGQLLAFQLGIVLLVLVGVVAVSLAQLDARFRDTEGGRARAVAETVAATGALRDALEWRRAVAQGRARRDPAVDEAVLIRTVAENNRSVSGSASVIVADADGLVVASADPDQLGTRLDLPDSPLGSGRSWLGEVERGGRTAVVAQVPVLSDGSREDPDSLGDVVGVAAVIRNRPSIVDNLRTAAPSLLTYLGIASALGVVGSLLLARRVKRQTLGLEPLEITGLVEHREALLHGIKEGVIALDRQDRVTLVNDVAAELLRLPPSAVGSALGDLGLSEAVVDVLSGRASGADLPVPVGDRVIILNRMPVASRGRPLGSVTTLRDRTELIALQRRLDAVQQATDTLRAQAHEFSNRLHTISGLVELGDYGEVAGYVQRITADHAELTDSVTSRIADPAVAALLVAKSSLAAEQGVRLRVTADSRMGPVDEQLSTDVATVVGNLVDNALDAVDPGGWIEVAVRHEDGGVTVAVRDSGPGVSPEHAADIFRRGFSTKTTDSDGERGIGLSLVRLVCVRRGGDVRLTGDSGGSGAVFVARLPVEVGAAP